ncbi:MAG: hypothetical protein R3176_04665 [Woeseiaceae bacterium]|nr:hypothetical protein [Woeseiaceae bacterium]
MLLSRLLGWIKERKTLHVFLLEVLAVFIGITASLLIDDWRQQRIDYETLDRELRALHYELNKEISMDRLAANSAAESLESAVLLAVGDIGSLSDEQLLEHYWRAVSLPRPPGQTPALQAGMATLSIPFDETVSIIEAELDNLQKFQGYLANRLAEYGPASRELAALTGLVFDQRFSADGLRDPDLVQRILALIELTHPEGQDHVVRQHNLANIRRVLADPGVMSVLRHMVPIHEDIAIASFELVQARSNVIDAIRRYAPDIKVPFREVGIDGSGTLFGWQTYLPMQKDAKNGSIWRITVDLVDGEIKFRADEAWAVNWGASVSEAGFGDENSWSFQGDIDRAFPSGIAQLEGSNIPVRAGRYLVTFNTDTLEYSFERVDTTE